MGDVVRINEFRARRQAPAGTMGPRDWRPGVPLITEKELSAEVHRSTRSIRRDRRAGMPAVPVGNGYRYDLERVLNWYRQADAS